jgi:EPS-associated MarR family transcriptional regulator
MDISKKDFQVLEALDNQEITSQRQLSEQAGISLGQVNYVLKSLLEKGLVKIGNFRKSPKKIGYAYLLTPKGFETKSRLAAGFVVSKLREYNRLRLKITEKLADIEKKGHISIIFVGPEIVREFVDSIIKEEQLKLILAGHCNNWQELTKYAPESFDIAILFDSNTVGIKKIYEATGIHRDKLVPLW